MCKTIKQDLVYFLTFWSKGQFTHIPTRHKQHSHWDICQAAHLHLRNCSSLLWSHATSWGPVLQRNAMTRAQGTRRTKRDLRHSRCPVMCGAPSPCSHYPLSGCWGEVERGGGRRWCGGGGDWLANPTSPVDKEQMGPDSLHTNHCQGGLSLLPWPFQNDNYTVYSNNSRVQGWGNERDVGEFTLYNPVVEKHERLTRTRHDIITTVSLPLASRYATNCDALCNLTPFYQNQHQRLQQFEQQWFGPQASHCSPRVPISLGYTRPCRRFTTVDPDHCRQGTPHKSCSFRDTLPITI